MRRAPDRTRSSRSRACPSPARCPTRHPPRSRTRARRPPAGPAGTWPTASNTTRAAVKQPSRGVLRSLTRLRRGPPATGDLALAGVRPEEVTARVVLHLERFVGYLTATYGHDRLPGGAPG